MGGGLDAFYAATLKNAAAMNYSNHLNADEYKPRLDVDTLHNLRMRVIEVVVVAAEPLSVGCVSELVGALRWQDGASA